MNSSFKKCTCLVCAGLMGASHAEMWIGADCRVECVPERVRLADIPHHNSPVRNGGGLGGVFVTTSGTSTTATGTAVLSWPYETS